MKKKNFVVFFFLFITLFFLRGNAHVALDYPQGGENFQTGETVEIQWHIIIPHNTENWDIYFSEDGGLTWQPVHLNLPASALSYQWIVPGTPTSAGRIKVVMDNTGTDYEASSGDFTIQSDPQFIKTPDQSLSTFTLYQNYPNPFNPTTVIKWYLPMASPVELTIFNIEGEKVNTLLSDFMHSGLHSVRFDASDLASGIYIYRLQTENTVQSKMMILTK